MKKVEMSNDLVNVSLSSEDEGANKTSTSNRPQHTEVAIDSDDIEEKSRLIQQVFQLQNTLDDLSQRVDAVKDENVKLKSENQILGQYIENLMSASSVFQGNNKSRTKPEKYKDGKK